MNLLQQVDLPNSDIEDYVIKLDELLLTKMEMLNQVRSKLIGFYKNLKKEEML